MNVIELQTRKRVEPDVWQCLCGNYTFRLYSTALVECAECGHEAKTMQGFWRVKELHESVQEQSGNIIRAFSGKTDS
jgi:Zn ribbon nucleic-acid-binding protein